MSGAHPGELPDGKRILDLSERLLSAWRSLRGRRDAEDRLRDALEFYRLNPSEDALLRVCEEATLLWLLLGPTATE